MNAMTCYFHVLSIILQKHIAKEVTPFVMNLRFFVANTSCEISHSFAPDFTDDCLKSKVANSILMDICYCLEKIGQKHFFSDQI